MIKLYEGSNIVMFSPVGWHKLYTPFNLSMIFSNASFASVLSLSWIAPMGPFVALSVLWALPDRPHETVGSLMKGSNTPIKVSLF